MGYIDEHLIKDEEVKHRGHLHRIIFLKPILLAVVALVVMFIQPSDDEDSLLNSIFTYAGMAGILIGLLWWLWVYADFRTSEFGVTNRRVLIKVGLIRRRTVEMFLNKVENIGVDQSVIGRIIRSGSLSITGSGGTQENFTNISRPFEFRKQVQEQIAQVTDEEIDFDDGD